MQDTPSYSLIEKVINFLYPSRCPNCGKDSYLRFYPFCKACWNNIRLFSGNRCLICSIPLPAHSSICGECIKERPLFKSSCIYGLYDGVLRDAIHYLKYFSFRNLAFSLGELLLNLSIPEADIIVPVPPDRRRLKRRGFNHTSLLARHISKRLCIPLEINLLIKVKETAPQVGLKREERLKNLRRAFRVTKRLMGERILLVDDVITTGVTAHECSRELIREGAGEIYLLAIARSAPDML